VGSIKGSYDLTIAATTTTLDQGTTVQTIDFSFTSKCGPESTSMSVAGLNDILSYADLDETLSTSSSVYSVNPMCPVTLITFVDDNLAYDFIDDMPSFTVTLQADKRKTVGEYSY
jgi:hypothetical protein